jgi:predicted  nucleic acid-binding Zn-ribbon protein
VADLESRRKDLEIKKAELENITAETQKEEDELSQKAKEAEQFIDERLLTAYNRLRNNSKNGLAVVTIQRDSCSGCYNQIPPQRQLDIRQHKKVIVCEHCGRILVDEALAGEKIEEAI